MRSRAQHDGKRRQRRPRYTCQSIVLRHEWSESHSSECGRDRRQQLVDASALAEVEFLERREFADREEVILKLPRFRDKDAEGLEMRESLERIGEDGGHDRVGVVVRRQRPSDGEGSESGKDGKDEGHVLESDDAAAMIDGVACLAEGAMEVRSEKEEGESVFRERPLDGGFVCESLEALVYEERPPVVRPADIVLVVNYRQDEEEKFIGKFVEWRCSYCERA
jgi:hypothetical protein